MGHFLGRIWALELPGIHFSVKNWWADPGTSFSLKSEYLEAPGIGPRAKMIIFGGFGPFLVKMGQIGHFAWPLVRVKNGHFWENGHISR